MIVDYSFMTKDGEKGEATQLFSVAYTTDDEVKKLIKRCDRTIRSVEILDIRGK